MDRDVALRLDGMLTNIRAALDGAAHYSKNNMADDEFKAIRRLIGASMYSTIEISTMLHEAYPDIVPKELTPPG